jgi:hypothetical protein
MRDQERWSQAYTPRAAGRPATVRTGRRPDNRRPSSRPRASPRLSCGSTASQVRQAPPGLVYRVGCPPVRTPCCGRVVHCCLRFARSRVAGSAAVSVGLSTHAAQCGPTAPRTRSPGTPAVVSEAPARGPEHLVESVGVLASRSRIRNRNWLARSPSSNIRLRARCASQCPAGFVVAGAGPHTSLGQDRPGRAGRDRVARGQPTRPGSGDTPNRHSAAPAAAPGPAAGP